MIFTEFQELYEYIKDEKNIEFVNRLRKQGMYYIEVLPKNFRDSGDIYTNKTGFFLRLDNTNYPFSDEPNIEFQTTLFSPENVDLFKITFFTELREEETAKALSKLS